MLIAAQLYTVREHIRDREGLGRVLRRLREIGYDGVEVAGLEAGLSEHLAEQLAAVGLTACAAHVSLDDLTADLGAVASRCKVWGCEYVVVPSAPTEFHSTSGYRLLAILAGRLAEQLRPYGMGLAYHNHAYELERLDGKNGLELLYESSSPADLKAELDTYWLEFADAGPAAWIRRLAGRVPLVHLKDMSILDGAKVQTEVGEGTLDWRDILSACRDAGTDWLIVEQDDCAGDPLASLEISYRNVTRLLPAKPPVGPEI